MYRPFVLLTDEGFRVRLRALEDIYRVLGSASKTVQSTQALPWERQAGQELVVETINNMRTTLIALYKKTPSTSELLLLEEKTKLWPVLLKGQHRLPAAEVSSLLIVGILHCAVCVPDSKSSTKHHSVFFCGAPISSSFEERQSFLKASIYISLTNGYWCSVITNKVFQ